MQNRGALAMLLFVSLAANVFAVTFWAASATRERMGALRPLSIVTAYRIADRLPEPAAANLRMRLDALQPQFDRELSLYDEALARGAAEMAREPIDAAALTEAIAEARLHRGRIGDLLTEAFVATVSDLPPQVRRRLVERFTDAR